MSDQLNRCLNCGGTARIPAFRTVQCECGQFAVPAARWNSLNPSSALEILSEGLRAINADGLCRASSAGDVECGCGVGGLVPCSDDYSLCQPAFRAHGMVDGEYCQAVYYPTRRAAQAAAAKTREELEREDRNADQA